MTTVRPGDAACVGGRHHGHGEGDCGGELPQLRDPGGDGHVVCWGDDTDGQATPPAAVDGTTGTATAIAAGAGGYHSCAIQEGTGAVVCWGNDIDGESTPPAAVDGTTGTASAIAAGVWHTLAIQQDMPTPTPTSTPTPGTPTPTVTPTPTPTDPIQGEIKLKIQLKFNKPSKDKIQVKIKDWQLPAGVVPTDVTVNVGGAEFTGTLDAEGKFKSPDKRDSITMKQSKKTQLWSITVKRKNNDFAADLWDEGCTNADNPKPGLPVTVPLTIEVGGVAYGRDVDLFYKSKLGKKGTAK